MIFADYKDRISSKIERAKRDKVSAIVINLEVPKDFVAPLEKLYAKHGVRLRMADSRVYAAWGNAPFPTQLSHPLVEPPPTPPEPKPILYHGIRLVD